MDPLLKVLLLDDAIGLGRLLGESPQLAARELDFSAAFTSCNGITPLHVCAEFNCLKCAKVLLEAGVDVNSRARLDANGIGGQTPIFHAVNSILNYCRPVMELLVNAGADLEFKLRGLLWGSGQSWETLVLDVTPMSYAQCGLYAQFHRSEQDTYSNLSYLYRRRYSTELPILNVPNQYLQPRK